MPLEIGQTLGAYRVIESLGQGGMATVYKAYHASLDRYVAIKILHPALKDDDTFSLRFQREAQIVAKLEHPNIVPVFDFATDADDPYIVMKFIEGQTLKHLLKRKHLSLEEMQQILPPIANALAYAHRRGVLHRDVKPSNVMIDGDNIPYLADFGLARIAASGESTMSQDVLIGTPNYISPEQAKGDKNLTPATDIYSLGIILYEIVVGRVPFSGDTPYAVVHDHIYKALPMPSHVNPSVPKTVERVLLKALCKDPQDRFQTATELLDAFQEAIQEADLKELSAASVQLDRFQDSTTNNTTAPTTSRDDLNELVREAVSKALATQAISSNTPPPTPPAIPTPIPDYATMPINSSVSRRRGRSKRAFWVLSGLAALIFICIASLWVFINALQNPIVQSNPALVDAREVNNSLILAPPPDLSIPLFTNITLSLEEAQALVAENPEDPSATLALSFLYLERGEQKLAQEYLMQTAQNPLVSGMMLADAARYTAAQGFNNDAIILWGIAYEREPNNPAIRNDAGQYLYRQMPELGKNEISPEDVQATLDNFNQLFSLGLVRVMIAHTLLQTDANPSLPLKEGVPQLLDYAIQKGDARAEAYLIYGDYYLAEGDLTQARDSWEFANSFVDTPQWVTREIESRLAEHTD